MMSHKLWVTAVGVVTYRQENERQAGREGGGKNTMMNAKRKYKDGEKKIKEMRCLLLKSMVTPIQSTGASAKMTRSFPFKRENSHGHGFRKCKTSIARQPSGVEIKKQLTHCGCQTARLEERRLPANMTRVQLIETELIKGNR
ncbi:hypothetical protein RUM43_008470 [Polyplax serrata]|uniref:Uncharacterized protein n=1 Tax=Polyplax serrata TaxID=468196 RepID=A0AAN8PFR2_POLSC